MPRYIPRRLFSPSRQRIATSGIRRARRVAFRRSLRNPAWLRVAARRALVSRTLTGGAAALGAYGAYRGYRRFRRARARASKRRLIGHRPKRPPKTDVLRNAGSVAKDSRTLHNYSLTDIAEGTNQNERETLLANITGWSVQMSFKNNNEVALHLTVAVVSPKYFNQGVQAIETEWLRQWGDDRAQDFSTARDSLELMRTPINADKWNILHRWDFKLGPREGSTTNKNLIKQPTEMTFKKWIPMKRQFRYETASSTVEAHPVYFVYWCDLSFAAPTSLPISNALQIEERVLTYFRDPK